MKTFRSGGLVDQNRPNPQIDSAARTLAIANSTPTGDRILGKPEIFYCLVTQQLQQLANLALPRFRPSLSHSHDVIFDRDPKNAGSLQSEPGYEFRSENVSSPAPSTTNCARPTRCNPPLYPRKTDCHGDE